MSNIFVVPLPVNITSGKAVAVALGMLAVLIACTRPATLFPGTTIPFLTYVEGTVTSMPLMRIVSPAVSSGLATVLEIIP